MFKKYKTVKEENFLFAKQVTYVGVKNIEFYAECFRKSVPEKLDPKTMLPGNLEFLILVYLF
jgi:hypothetical protein